MLDYFIKRPNDHLDFEFDFSRWMTDGDTVSNAVGTVSIASSTVTNVVWDEVKVRVWIEGGDAGASGQINVLIETDQGRRKEVTAHLRIMEC